MRFLVLLLAVLSQCALAAAAPCPRGTGDIAPGMLLAGSPPRWSPEGDGRITVADAVASLREAVGLQLSEGPLVGGSCASLPADLAPGRLDLTTAPPTWHPLGDGVVNVADALVTLRASTGLVQLAPLQERVARQLERVAGCEDLEQRLKAAAHVQFDQAGTWSSAWWWGRWGGGPERDSDGELSPTTAGGGAPAHSATNVQEQGVDEPDLVDTDGSLVITLGGGKLRVLRASAAGDIELLASSLVEGQAMGLFLDRGHAVVTSQVWSAVDSWGAIGIADFAPAWGATKVSAFDLSDPAAPRLAREMYVDGWLHAARAIDGRSVLVMNHSLRGPELPAWSGDDAAWRAVVHAAIDTSSIEDWLPEIVDLRHDRAGATTVQRRFAIACEDVRLETDGLPGGFVSVLEFDAVNAGAVATASVAGVASTVHVGRRRVTVAMDDWRTATSRPQTESSTRLQVFALGGATGKPRYLGAGRVPGWIVSPWSLDDEGEEMRVATTRSDAQWRPSTSVFVLLPDGTGDLRVTGSIEGIAPGETLQAARFMADRGYLVTFERIDPLFVLDLSDPSAPRVTGELEITGWSSYLHPIEGHRLIGIGREVDPLTQQQLGMHVSLFDVSNPAAPALEERHLESSGWQSSEAEWDHHAFTYFEPLQLLAIPLVAWQPCTGCNPTESWRNELRLYRVAAGEGVEPRGAVRLPFDPCAGAARRAVFIGDVVIALAETGAASARAADPSAIVSSVIYSDAPECGPAGTQGGEPGGAGGG